MLSVSADASNIQNGVLIFDPTKLVEQDGIVTCIEIAGLMDFSFCEKEDVKLPIYIDREEHNESESSIPLNTVELPESLHRELGPNLMDWFYSYARNNVKDYEVPEVKKRQPVAQVISYTIVSSNNEAPEVNFSLKKPSERQIMVILRYNLSGTKFENFILDAETPIRVRKCAEFEPNDIVVTVGIALVLEPSWSSTKRWDNLPYSFSGSGHFISWGKFVLPDSMDPKAQMVSTCKEISNKAFFPSYKDLCENMLNRIGLNPALNPTVIMSKSSSLLALDFTSLVTYTEGGGVKVCMNSLQYLKFYKVTSYIKAHPDIFSFSKGVGKIETIDPRKITLYHFDEGKKVYILFEIEVATSEWTRLPRCVKPEEIRFEGIERRADQYL